MNDQPEESGEDLNPYLAQVIGYVDAHGDLKEEPSAKQFNLLINLGSDNQISVGARVLIFSLGQEIFDPKSGDSLGHFEIVRGEGKINSVQKRMAIVRSSERTIERRPRSMNALSLAAGAKQEYDSVEVFAPFKNPTIGDLVRFI